MFLFPFFFQYYKIVVHLINETTPVHCPGDCRIHHHSTGEQTNRRSLAPIGRMHPGNHLHRVLPLVRSTGQSRCVPSNLLNVSFFAKHRLLVFVRIMLLKLIVYLWSSRPNLWILFPVEDFLRWIFFLFPGIDNLYFLIPSIFLDLIGLPLLIVTCSSLYSKVTRPETQGDSALSSFFGKQQQLLFQLNDL